MRAGLVAAVAIVLSGAAAEPCHASRLTGGATSGPDATGFVIYRAAPGERNHVSVRLYPLTIVDRGVRRIRLGGGTDGCRHGGPRRVVCDLPDNVVLAVLRDRDDTIGFIPGGDRPDKLNRSPFTVEEEYSSEADDMGGIDHATDVLGGRGDDRITGSSLDDFVDPGPGRDVVDGRGGADRIFLRRDGVSDAARGGGGVDGLYPYRVKAPLTVDLRAGLADAGADRDRVSGFERLHGGPMDDILLGGARSEAIYGEGGSDRIAGRGGRDLLTGDAPDAKAAFANRISGGRGDDVLDARGVSLAPTSSIDCGAGADVEAGEVDDLLGPDCETVAYNGVPLVIDSGFPLYSDLRAFPVDAAADGTPTFRVRCPTREELPTSGCKGTLALERPPEAPAGGDRATYGSGTFDLRPGQETDVAVPLTAEGEATVTAGMPVAAHLTTEDGVDIGWQLVIPR